MSYIGLAECSLAVRVSGYSASLITLPGLCVFSGSKVGIAIGLAIGLGVPIVVAIIIVVCLLMRRKSKNHIAC